MDLVKYLSPLLIINLLILSPISLAEQKLYYVHNDHNGTPQMLTDEDRKVVWKVESQTPLGEVVINEDPDSDGNKVEFNLRFPGQYFDKETNTNYNYHRTYDPSLARYIQSDPIGLRGGLIPTHMCTATQLDITILMA